MTDGVVAELAAQARAAGRLGIDTEFMGEGRYRALLCLVQIAVEAPDGLRVEVLDPLTEDYDPAPLAAVLADAKVQVVVHAGRQDVALLRREWSTDVNALGEALVRARAAEAELAYELIAARADLQRIVTAVRNGDGEPEVRTLQGWRRAVVGAELLELLQGRRSLRVGPGRRIEVQA